MILEIFGKTLKIKIGERPVFIYNENVPQMILKIFGKTLKIKIGERLCLFTTKMFRKMILEIFGKTLKIKIGGRHVLIYNENVPQNDTGNLRENTKNQNRRAPCAYLQRKCSAK